MKCIEQGIQIRWLNSCNKSSSSRSVYSQCHVVLLKCTEQNVNNQTLTRISQLYVHIFFCLKVVRSWLNMPTGGHGHVICMCVEEVHQISRCYPCMIGEVMENVCLNGYCNVDLLSKVTINGEKLFPGSIIFMRSNYRSSSRSSSSSLSSSLLSSSLSLSSPSSSSSSLLLLSSKNWDVPVVMGYAAICWPSDGWTDRQTDGQMDKWIDEERDFQAKV